MSLFANRVEAGQRLAQRLTHLEPDGPVILGLPRGGVPVAYEVARALRAPLDVILVRKLGVPFQPELAMGAVGEGGVLVVNETVVRDARLSGEEIKQAEARERHEIARRTERFRRGRDPVPLAGRVVVVVDDGIATGSTARAACQVARAHGAERVVLATPVAPSGVRDRFGDDVDDVVVLASPEVFVAIGQFYADFSQTSDSEVATLLARATEWSKRPGSGSVTATDDDVEVTADALRLPGRLTVPASASGVVVFAHGSGSSRHSPRNKVVGGVLSEAGLGTLLFDLLTGDEEAERGNVFDIGLLASRLLAATAWLRSAGPALPVAYFGASTGAAAALWAAAEPGADIASVVSRGGRPDLAGVRLGDVRSPTLLVVGGDDEQVLDLNRQALSKLLCESRLDVVPGASHLFEEPGTLEEAAHLARDWFLRHFAAASAPPG